MTEAPKLLTEREWREMLTQHVFDMREPELRERGLIAPEPVDPLLEEAEVLHQDWIARKHEDAIAMLIAALKRGMELARPLTLTREQLVVMLADAGFTLNAFSSVTGLHTALVAALTRETPDA